jgi:hypothetical protein
MTTINWLMLFTEIIVVYFANHKKHINTLCPQNAQLMNMKLRGIESYRFALKR